MLYNHVLQASKLLSAPSCACRSSGCPLEDCRLEYLKIIGLGKLFRVAEHQTLETERKLSRSPHSHCRASPCCVPVPAFLLLAVRSLSAAGSGPGLEGTCELNRTVIFFFIYSNYRASAPASGMRSCRLIIYYLDFVPFFLVQLLVRLQW